MSDPHPLADAGSRIAHRFRVVSRLGSGGMGAVFLAEDEWRDGARVALKCASLDDFASRDALRSEFLRLSALEHPNVIAVREAGACRATRLAWYSMDHADAGSSSHLSGASPALVVPMLAQALGALAYVHSRRTVHRDVKRDNLVITGEGPDALLRLVDFGLSVAEGTSRQHEGFSGTFTHAAPELFGDGPITSKVDIYGLGVVAHAWLSGKLPFEHSDPLALARAHREEPPPPLAQVARDVPRALASLVDRMLAKDPAERPDALEALALLRGSTLAEEATEEAWTAWAHAPWLVGLEEAEADLDGLTRSLGAGELVSVRTIVIEGPEGSGKSRLLEHAVARAQLLDIRVLAGRAGSAPLSLLAEPIRDAVRILPGASEIRGHASVLARIAPELASASAPPPPQLTPADERLRLARAVMDVLRAVAAVRPVLLLLDDVERADDDTIDVLDYLARNLAREAAAGVRVAIVVAARSKAPAESALRRLSDTTLLQIRPLDAAGMSTLVGSMFPGLDASSALSDAIERGVGSKPALAEEWCASLIRSGALSARTGRWSLDIGSADLAHPPDGLGHAIERDVAMLAPPDREVAMALALLESRVPVRLLSAWLGRDVAHSLEILEARQLVRVEVGRDQLGVQAASQAVREAARRVAPDLARAVASRLLDATTDALPADARASLAESAARTDEAIALFGDALDRARENADALRVADLAAHVARLTTGPPQRRAWRQRTRALLDLDRVALAETTLPMSAAMMGGADELAEQKEIEGLVMSRLGRFGDAADAAAEGLKAAGEAGWSRPRRVEVALLHARSLSASADPRAESAIDAVIALALEPSDQLGAELARGSWLLRQARNDEAEVALGSALRWARSLGRAQEEASCENNLGVLAMRRGALASAARHLENAARVRERIGARGALAGTLSNLALLELERGRSARAARHAQACLDIQLETGQRHGELLALLNLAAAHADGGDVRRMDAILPRIRELMELVGSPVLRVAFELLEIERELFLGVSPQDREGMRSRVDGLIVLAREAHAGSQGEALQSIAWSLGPQDVIDEIRRALVNVSPRLNVEGLCLLATHLAPAAWSAEPRETVDAREAVTLATQAMRGARELPDDAKVRACLALAGAMSRMGASTRKIERQLASCDTEVGRVRVAALRLEWLHARAWCARQRGDSELADGMLVRAMELVRAGLRRIPRAERERYLAHPLRRRTRDLLVELRRSRDEAAGARDFFALLPRAQASTVEAVAAVTGANPENGRLREILDISRGINELLPVEELLDRVLQAAMSFVDADRGFIMLGDSAASLAFARSRDRSGREVPESDFAVSRSILEEAVRSRHGMLSSDARADERFTSKASVLALDLRSVLVVPLVAREEILGVLYVDNRSSTGVFDENDREMLGLLATQAAVAVSNARLHRSSLVKERMEQELDLARSIQQGLLPSRLPDTKALRVAAVMEPAREIGGDFYDVLEGPRGCIRLVIGDVSGKGVPAGLFMVMARTVLRARGDEDAPLDRILAGINDDLIGQIDESSFLTALMLESDPDGSRVRFCLAGHEPPVLYRRATGSCEALSEGGVLLGMFPRIAGRLEERSVEMAPGDIIVAVTDGVTECRAADGSMFGRARLVEAVRLRGDGGAPAVRDELLRQLAEFRGVAERSDDVTLIALERRDARGEATR